MSLAKKNFKRDKVMENRLNAEVINWISVLNVDLVYFLKKKEKSIRSYCRVQNVVIKESWQIT